MQWLSYAVGWLCSGLGICNPTCTVEACHTSTFAKVKIEHG